MLEEAKTKCDYLIVGLQSDPTIDRPKTKHRPVQSIVERQVQLRGCRYVDEIILYNSEEDLLDILKTVRWDIRIIGQDYSGKHFTGKELCSIEAGTLYYNKREHGFSSTDLRKRIIEDQYLA
tara:strand:+ start:107 stop:472 length:366 start_codon:yes stop_codon:yes gene_type:complete